LGDAPPAKEDREEEDVPDPLVFGLHRRRRVEQRATTVQTTPRLCSTVPEDFFVFLL
jgi:hypothetical protein